MKSDNSKIRPRLNWLDAMKGFTMLWVILGHVLLGYSGQKLFNTETTGYILTAKNFIYLWHMPLFMFLSGISYALSVRKNGVKNPEKLKSSLFNLVILYLIFSLLLDGLKLVFSAFVNSKVDPAGILKDLLIPDQIMWYLWALILFYIFFYFIEDLIPEKILGIVCFLAGFIMAVIVQSVDLRLGLKNIFYTCVFFWAGIHWQECTAYAKKKWIILLSTLIIVGYIIWYAITPEIKVIDGGLAFLAAIAVCFLLLRLFLAWKGIAENSFLIFVGKTSIIFYLVHTYLVTAARQAAAKFGIGNPILAILLAFGIPLLISCCIVLVVNRIYILQVIFKPALLLKKGKKS